jgi:hypothetical protein
MKNDKQKGIDGCWRYAILGTLFEVVELHHAIAIAENKQHEQTFQCIYC